VTQQKSLKRRVRARMAKTGERYTSARRQVLAKATTDGPAATPLTLATPEQVEPAPTNSTSDEAVRKATGRSHAEWFELLDAWGATAHTHTEIAEWLSSAHGAPSWWRQSITVDYERARGMRGRHQMADGFRVSVSRTVTVPPDRALAAFVDDATLRRWLPGAPMEPRPTRAKLTARFDWSDPASRVVVNIAPKGTDRSIVAVTHERIPDAAVAERLKAGWRDRLGHLKAFLEAE
jgi:uncharacterized protein YndB with AHSA1/START domain